MSWIGHRDIVAIFFHVYADSRQSLEDKLNIPIRISNTAAESTCHLLIQHIITSLRINLFNGLTQLIENSKRDNNLRQFLRIRVLSKRQGSKPAAKK